jgi:hypothetical protein
MKEKPVQSEIFREKNPNEKQTHQSFNKSMVNRNHQSQIILVEKPYGYQSATGWNLQNKAKQSVMNQSFIENLNSFTQDKTNNNSNSQISIRNQSAVNFHHLQRQVSGQKMNFVPQIYEPVYFHQIKGNENSNSNNECKKVRKSGLSLMKASLNVTSSRTKLQV